MRSRPLILLVALLHAFAVPLCCCQAAMWADAIGCFAGIGSSIDDANETCGCCVSDAPPQRPDHPDGPDHPGSPCEECPVCSTAHENPGVPAEAVAAPSPFDTFAVVRGSLAGAEPSGRPIAPHFRSGGPPPQPRGSLLALHCALIV